MSTTLKLIRQLDKTIKQLHTHHKKKGSGAKKKRKKSKSANP